MVDMPSKDNIFARHDFDSQTPANTRGQSDARRQGLSDYIPSSFTIGSMSTYGSYLTIFIKFSFYVVIFILFSLVFLLVLQALGFKTFSFLPDDGGLISLPMLPTNRQIKFANQRMVGDISSNLLNVVSSNYTVSLDVYIKNDFINQSVPRVLLYKTANPVVLTASDTSIPRIILKMPQTNFVLYLDAYTNDLMATVVCQSAGSPSGPSGPSSPSGPSGPSGLRASATQNTADSTIMREYGIKTISIAPISNVPIQTPFRVTMMLSDILLEIYINGDLQKSIPFNGNTLRLVPANTQFYGPPQIVGQSVLISNLSYWNTSLSSKSIRVYGKEPLNASVFTTT